MQTRSTTKKFYTGLQWELIKSRNYILGLNYLDSKVRKSPISELITLDNTASPSSQLQLPSTMTKKCSDIVLLTFLDFGAYLSPPYRYKRIIRSRYITPWDLVEEGYLRLYYGKKLERRFCYSYSLDENGEFASFSFDTCLTEKPYLLYSDQCQTCLAFVKPQNMLFHQRKHTNTLF